jgi:16S rRNA (adenine1518-N6/adenine1519-N6)-dimethyltransferase
MVQREVAQRMTASPGSSAYGFLSLLVQLHCRARTLLQVKREAFRPRPNVDATVVRLDPREGPLPAGDERNWLLEVISIAFRSRRKTLFNNLRGDKRFAGKDDPLEELLRGQGIDRSCRGEALPLETFINLARVLSTLAAPTAG